MLQAVPAGGVGQEDWDLLGCFETSLVLGLEEQCCLQISKLGWNLGQDAAHL